MLVWVFMWGIQKWGQHLPSSAFFVPWRNFTIFQQRNWGNLGISFVFRV
jgi:hypothetical protein